MCACPEPIFNANQQFLFTIFNKSANKLLFIGQYLGK